MSRAASVGAAVAVLCSTALGLWGCGRPDPGSVEPTAEVPTPDMTDMEPQVARRLRETRAAVLANPASGEAWGRFGMVAHAHELWYEAEAAYRRAERLDPGDERWPYYLGDVLSVIGTDPEAAARAFRRAMARRPDYGPAHLRLGRVLLAAGRDADAARELERALELEPELQPARVALAQIRLSQGRLERAAEMLEEVLAEQPRHGQALSTLGQVYMRLGRRDEAREIARRARGAALYNLYSDPLMAPVDEQGVSSAVLWERAKAFFDNGNFEQAVRGLRQVATLLPANADVHHQLAVAYGNLADLERTRHHLERTIALDPDRVTARIQLAIAELDGRDPAAAIPQLERVLELDPDDADAGWLLGRALLLTGDVDAALATFERTAATVETVPAWAHAEWGSALAQQGRLEAALEHFEAALAVEPQNAQALFYAGLALEGLGRVDLAVERYCSSRLAAPDSPAASRLQALGRGCG